MRSPLRIFSRARLTARRASASSLAFFALALGALRAAPTDDVYKLGPDSLPQPGVPQGKVTDWAQLPSQAYPGTLHDYCVYVPAQYDPKQPAALMIFQDGQAFLRPTGDYRATNVFDNLIYRREMPVTIAWVISPVPTKPIFICRPSLQSRRDSEMSKSVQVAGRPISHMRPPVLLAGAGNSALRGTSAGATGFPSVQTKRE